MRIPYGQSNFADLRRERFFYVDKTPFLPQLESAEAGYRHVLFLRPRRFGKSLFVSMLEHYYDVNRREQFDELFGGLWLNPDVPAGRYAWMLEVKYLKTQAKPSEIKRAFDDASEQLDRYASDQALVPLLTLGKELKAGTLVFVGAKDVLFRPWPAEPRPAKRMPARTTQKKASPKKAAKSRRRRGRLPAKR